MEHDGEKGLNHEYMGSTGAPPAAWQGPKDSRKVNQQPFQPTASHTEIRIPPILTSLPGGQTGFLIVVNIFIFFLAFFLDFFEIAFIILPLLGPVADKMGIDLIWFGVMICVNMQTSFMHPPFGFALFYLRGISDTLFKNNALPAKVESRDIYLGSIPFIVLQLILVAIVIAFPQTVTALLDKKVEVDLDKVEIPMTAPAEGAPDTQENIEELFKSAAEAASAPK